MNNRPNPIPRKGNPNFKGLRVFLTGGDSFVGSAIANALLKHGAKIRVLVSSKPPFNSQKAFLGLENLDVEKIKANLFDSNAMTLAMADCQLVFHCAEDYRTWAKNPADIVRTNVSGTESILKAAFQARVERVVHMSRAGVLGRLPGNALADEKTAVSFKDMVGRYQKSKYRAEQIALGWFQMGLPVVIVNPTASVGERDGQPTPVGKLLIKFASKKLKGYIEAGRNFADVRDVAWGHLAAAMWGRPGERYLLGGHNLTLEQFLEIASECTKIPLPKKKFPRKAALAFAAVSTIQAWIFGGQPSLSLDAARASQQKLFFDSGKAKRELGWQPSSLKPAIERALEWFRENDYLPGLRQMEN